MLTWEEIWPPFRVHITCGHLHLTTVRESDVPELAALAAGGVATPGTVAFPNNWDVGTEAEIARSLATFHWKVRAGFTVSAWIVEFAVRRGGTLLGCIGARATDFPTTRTVDTGSWLASSAQGRGTGTLARQALAVAFFDRFGAAELTSGADVGNHASVRVSEKLGYRRTGTYTLTDTTGLQATGNRFRLLPADLLRPADPVEVTGVEAFRDFLGLDSPATG